MQHPHAPHFSAAELAWLHTLVGFADPAHTMIGYADPAHTTIGYAAPAHALGALADPALSKAERLSLRKARNRTSASDARERRNAHVRALEAAVRELERDNADLLAQIQLETAQNVLLKAAAARALMPEGS